MLVNGFKHYSLHMIMYFYMDKLYELAGVPVGGKLSVSDLELYEI